VNSHITKQFREAFAQLPESVRQQARAAYRLFRDNPHHPSLHFKQVHATRPIYSARVGEHYRALGVRDNNEMVWFWIGSHAEYDRLLKQL
jgi:hypothetical protein